MRIPRSSPLALLVVALCAGCAADNPVVPDATHDYGVASDLLSCEANNDGVIELGELLFDQTGLVATYRVNPPGTLDGVDVQGQLIAGKREWKHDSLAGVVLTMKTEDPRDWWFAEHFPGATLAIASDAGADTYQVLALDAPGNRMLLMGLASAAPDTTLMVYNPPIEIMRFPLRVGLEFTATGEVSEGKLRNLPIATNDTYEVEVDSEGTVLLPRLSFQRTLRMRVTVTSRGPGGTTAKAIQYQWFHECFGEIVRAVAEPTTGGGEPDPLFSQASEYRRLSFTDGAR